MVRVEWRDSPRIKRDQHGHPRRRGNKVLHSERQPSATGSSSSFRPRRNACQSVLVAKLVAVLKAIGGETAAMWAVLSGSTA
jgi:hypothetical protein